MNRDAVLAHFKDTGALLEGHFVLSSGLHSPVYLQCAKVLMHPDRAAILCQELANKIHDNLGEIDLVVSPAVGGVVIGYEMARQLRIPAIFAERAEGKLQLRRGFEISDGAKVLVVDDILTTGLSAKECAICVAENGGQVKGLACLLDRSGGAADIGMPVFSLAALDVPTYETANLPPDLAAIEPYKPGSRGLR